VTGIGAGINGREYINYYGIPCPTWSAVGSGGNGSYSYQWLRSDNDTLHFHQVTTASSYFVCFQKYQMFEMYLRLVITSAGKTATANMHVHVAII
jgi:hypothetical protein